MAQKPELQDRYIGDLWRKYKPLEGRDDHADLILALIRKLNCREREMWLMVVGANGYRIRCERMESLTLNGIHRLLPYSTVLVWDVTLDREGTDGWWAR